MTMTATQPVVIVEDNDEDFESLTWAMRRLSISIPVVRCLDGDDALDLLFERGDYSQPPMEERPAVVLLDLNLTTVDGREVLSAIKQDERLKSIPVIIWTTSSNERDIEMCYQNGANSYIVKPGHMDKLLSAVALIERYWLKVVSLPV